MRAARSAGRSRSCTRCSIASTATHGSVFVSTRAISTCRGTTSSSREEVERLVEELDSRIGLDRLRALHVNDSAAPLGSNRDRHANILEGELGENLGAFLGHPAFQQLSAYLEVPGKNKKGPDADEIQKLRDLHARWA